MVKKWFDWLLGREYELEKLRLQLQTQVEIEKGRQATLETILDKTQQAIGVSQEGLKAVAEASAEQSKSLSEWIKMFQTPNQPTSSTVRDEDEWYQEVQRYKKEFGADILSPEMELALKLRQLDGDG